MDFSQSTSTPTRCMCGDSPCLSPLAADDARSVLHQHLAGLKRKPPPDAGPLIELAWMAQQAAAGGAGGTQSPATALSAQVARDQALAKALLTFLAHSARHKEEGFKRLAKLIKIEQRSGAFVELLQLAGHMLCAALLDRSNADLEAAPPCLQLQLLQRQPLLSLLSPQQQLWLVADVVNGLAAPAW